MERVGGKLQTHHLETPFFHLDLALPSTTLTLSRKFTTIFAPTFTFGPSEFVTWAKPAEIYVGWRDSI